MACNARGGKIRPFSILRFGATLAIIGATMVGAPNPARASDPSDICDQAAYNAAQATGVPISVLKAISLTETGRKKSGKMRPWPWTVNMEGKGVWFDTQHEALEYVEKNHARGARSYDVGCFQLNYKWHGQNFASIQQMFEPQANALYAARFLLDLHREKGNWTDAAGAYHSRTKKYADKYKKRFDRYRTAFVDEENQRPDPNRAFSLASATTVRTTQRPRINNFPLLKAGTAARGLGSLVPDTPSNGGLFRGSGG